LDLLRQNEWYSEIAAACETLGDIHLARGNLSGAKENYLQALGTFYEGNNLSRLAGLIVRIAGAYVLEGAPFEAHELASLVLASSRSDYATRMRAESVLTGLGTQLGPSQREEAKTRGEALDLVDTVNTLLSEGMKNAQ
jgi:hypothetical protein